MIITEKMKEYSRGFNAFAAGCMVTGWMYRDFEDSLFLFIAIANIYCWAFFNQPTKQNR